MFGPAFSTSRIGGRASVMCSSTCSSRALRPAGSDRSPRKPRPWAGISTPPPVTTPPPTTSSCPLTGSAKRSRSRPTPFGTRPSTRANSPASSKSSSRKRSGSSTPPRPEPMRRFTRCCSTITGSGDGGSGSSRCWPGSLATMWQGTTGPGTSRSGSSCRWSGRSRPRWPSRRLRSSSAIGPQERPPSIRRPRSRGVTRSGSRRSGVTSGKPIWWWAGEGCPTVTPMLRRSTWRPQCWRRAGGAGSTAICGSRGS